MEYLPIHPIKQGLMIEFSPVSTGVGEEVEGGADHLELLPDLAASLQLMMLHLGSPYMTRMSRN